MAIQKVLKHRERYLAPIAYIVMGVVFLLLLGMAFVKMFVVDNDPLMGLDIAAFLLLSIIAFVDFMKNRRLKFVLWLGPIYLGTTHLLRVFMEGGYANLPMAYVPLVIVLVSFTFSMRLALGFILLYSLIPSLSYFYLFSDGAQFRLFQEMYTNSMTPAISIFAAIFLAANFAFMFDFYRKSVGERLEALSFAETDKKFFATISHEINNPITIAILALGRNYTEGEDEKTDRVLRNLKLLAKHSAEYENSSEKNNN